MENKLQKYKDVWYAYFPTQDVWYISEREDQSGNVTICSAIFYRVDQAINKMKQNEIRFNR
jgi:hypothetical protein